MASPGVRASSPNGDNRQMFDVVIWGTVAAWAGAIGSSAAFFLAVGVYRRDARSRRYEQAVMVRLERKPWVSPSTPPLPEGLDASTDPDSPEARAWMESGEAEAWLHRVTEEALVAAKQTTVVLHNTSDKAIYTVSAILHRRTLWEMVKPNTTSSYPSAMALFADQTARQIRETPRFVWGIPVSMNHTPWEASLPVDRIAPGDSIEFRFDSYFAPYQRLVVEFTDAQNRRWELKELSSHCPGSNPRSLEPARNWNRAARRDRLIWFIKHPKGALEYRREWKKLHGWARRNDSPPWESDWPNGFDFDDYNTPEASTDHAEHTPEPPSDREV